MGFNTEFDGELLVEPPLNGAEIDYLLRFAEARHMDRSRGPYYVGDDESDVRDQNSPDVGQPGLWCDFEPSEGGSVIAWNGNEKTYNAAEWITYLINNFLSPTALAIYSQDPQFEQFTFDHVVNGTVRAYPEDGRFYSIVVKDNTVLVTSPTP